MTSPNAIQSYFGNFPLNAQQIEAASQLESFIVDDLEQIFVLSGYAGTGKTTLLKGVLDFLEGHKRNFLAMAPTGKASRVLSNKTGHIANTIHSSIFYVSVGQNEEIVFRLRETPSNGMILLIDEASMLKSHPLYMQSNMNDESLNTLLSTQFEHGIPAIKIGEFLLNDLISFATLPENPKTKIIFVGDSAQLPPIGTNKSLVFDREFMESLCHGYRQAELTKVERNDNHILAAATYVREQIICASPIDTYPLLSADVKAVDYKDLIFNFLKDNPTISHCDDSIMVFGSNSKVHQANEAIRSYYFGYNNTSKIQVNDKIMVYANHYGESHFFNGDNLSVLEVNNEIRENILVPLSNYQKEQIAKDRLKFVSTLPLYITIEGDSVRVILNIISLKVKDTDDNEENIYISKDFLNSEDSESHRIYRRALAILSSKVSKKYELDCSSKKVNMEPDILLQLCSPFSECLFVKFAYAITCHKAQGGEWKNVYTNICTIPNRANSIQHFKWIYTAYTRASKKLIVGVPRLRAQFIQPFNKTMTLQIQ